jgi:hypothetical protein
MVSIFRGRSPKTLEGLRRRIRRLFLEFAETPEFNPRASELEFAAATDRQTSAAGRPGGLRRDETRDAAPVYPSAAAGLPSNMVEVGC